MGRTKFPEKDQSPSADKPTLSPGNGRKPRAGGWKPYIPDRYDEQIFLMARQGLTQNQIAQRLNISNGNFQWWFENLPHLPVLLKKGRWLFDSQKVERTLLDRCLGYEYDEVVREGIVLVRDDGEEVWYVEQKESTANGNGNGKAKKQVRLVEGSKVRITHKHIPAEPTLLMFWLQNREPDEWKNVQKQIVETSGEVHHYHEVDLSKLGREELENLRGMLSKARRNADAVGAGSRSGTRPAVPAPLRPALLESGRES